MKPSDNKELCTHLLSLGYLGESDWHSIEEWLWENHRMWIYIGIEYTHNQYDWEIIKYSEWVDNSEDSWKSPITAKIEGIKAAVKYLNEQLKHG